MTRRDSPQQYWALAGFLGSAAVAVLLHLTLDVFPYFAWLGGASAALFAFYGFDKRRAVAGGRRIPEGVLHGLALAGGFAGGWAGRVFFRHKTRRAGFMVVLVLATLLHGVAVVWMELRA